ncbi:hypothetical protein [Delftia lacustris]|nr:hypothetical protein [Delftia lacustris]
MTKYIIDAAMRAFEEKYSTQQNKYFSNEIEFYGRQKPIFTKHRATEFEVSASIPDGIYPDLAVQLVAITHLAIHLCKRKTMPYRVRREQARISSGHANLYTPRTDFEFHFEALHLFISKNHSCDSLLKRANVLHPATFELIKLSTKIYTCKLLPKHQSWEEDQVLSPEQSRRNLISQKMSEWSFLPSNKNSIKFWNDKHVACAEDFLEKWTDHAKKYKCFILRADLIYSSPFQITKGFGTPSHHAVRENVTDFLEAMRRNPKFRDAKFLLSPYSDMNGQWQLPLVALIPGTDRNRPAATMEIQNTWESIASVTGKSLESQMRNFEGEYRFISHDQNMFDNVEQQIFQASIYHFHTKIIADTCIDTVSTQQDFGTH